MPASAGLEPTSALRRPGRLHLLDRGLLGARRRARRLVHSSAANSLVELILSRLKQEDIVVDGVSPNFLTRYWPPALPEWSTKSVRDAFYASPKFPRLLKPDAETCDLAPNARTLRTFGIAQHNVR